MAALSVVSTLDAVANHGTIVAMHRISTGAIVMLALLAALHPAFAGAAHDPASVCALAHMAGEPQIPGLRIVYLAPLGDPVAANRWRNIIAHQTEGAPGSAKSLALAQAANPTKRGVMIWVETDGTIYWATPESAIPTHGDGANRNDNKYIDNASTYHQVVRDNSIGVEFAGNYPDVTRGATDAQIAAWRLLVRVLRSRYGIALDHVYAHNWIDFKDARYCEGCALATMARQWGE